MIVLREKAIASFVQFIKLVAMSVTLKKIHLFTVLRCFENAVHSTQESGPLLKTAPSATASNFLLVLDHHHMCLANCFE